MAASVSQQFQADNIAIQFDLSTRRMTKFAHRLAIGANWLPCQLPATLAECGSSGSPQRGKSPTVSSASTWFFSSRVNCLDHGHRQLFPSRGLEVEVRLSPVAEYELDGDLGRRIVSLAPVPRFPAPDHPAPSSGSGRIPVTIASTPGADWTTTRPLASTSPAVPGFGWKPAPA